jgi:hypothetical protein
VRAWFDLVRSLQRTPARNLSLEVLTGGAFVSPAKPALAGAAKPVHRHAAGLETPGEARVIVDHGKVEGAAELAPASGRLECL